MTLSQKQRKFFKMFHLLQARALALGYEFVIEETFRTQEKQDQMVMKGKSKTANSKHLNGLAADLGLFKDGKYLTKSSDHSELGEYWKSLDPENIWGGDWGWDGNHYQYTR